MKKENIFDLWEKQHKDDPKSPPERVENEVRPEDLEGEKEVTKQPEQKQEPEQKQDPEPKQEGGK